ncbi:helix-turn-helix domain-containing protein [Desulfospira joergensenii]|uniref:helix-turn-helix domain-containing protein n=1 Tax=Desulfospira joergensenii TaxID=53329 RepID=UPI0003B76C29|nr:XRE family transcriptional regulator [Desulfospira joergensenii]
MEQPIDSISNNLKRIREARNLSLEGLSELSGVSKSMLRQIETGKSNPTIATIWKIANGLKVSFTSLLRRPAVEAKVSSFTGGTPLTSESAHYRLFPLIPFEPEQSFETYYIEIDPGTIFFGEPHEGNVYEYVFVVKGRMEILVDEKAFKIKENEFLQFRADRPHKYRCLGESTARAIMQISYLG